MRIVGEPRPHFSFSQMDSYLACPHKYYLGYEQGLQWGKILSAGVNAQFTRFWETLGDFPFPFVDLRRMSKTIANWGSNSVVARFSTFTKDTLERKKAHNE